MLAARTVMVSIGMAVGVGAVACSSGSSSGGSQGPTTSGRATASSTSAPTSTTTPTEASTVAAYRAFWDAYVAAGDPMDPQSAALKATAVNPALETVQRSFLAHLAGGEVIRGQLELHPAAGDVTGTTATLTDCYLDRTHVFIAATGAQVDDPADNTFAVTVTLTQVDGTWKVSLIQKDGQGCTPA